MTLEEYATAIRTLAASDGVVAHETYWAPHIWRSWYENGLTPSDAWDHERNPALCAL